MDKKLFQALEEILVLIIYEEISIYWNKGDQAMARIVLRRWNIDSEEIELLIHEMGECLNSTPLADRMWKVFLIKELVRKELTLFFSLKDKNSKNVTEFLPIGCQMRMKIILN